jgi:biotin carboxylase
VTRLLLIVPSEGYRTADFVAAARAQGSEVVIGSDRRQLADTGAVRLDLSRPGRAAEQIVALARERPLDAIVAADDEGVVAAALAGERLGLAHNPPDAARATRDKQRMRRLLASAGVSQPDFVVADSAEGVVAAAARLGYPCVVKPRTLSASRGVIRVDDDRSAAAAATRVLAMTRPPLLVERFVGGPEIALECLLRDGRLELLAVFDKPDPLEGPLFAETLYVTPSRHAPAALEQAAATVAAAAAAIGLRQGPVHAEARLTPAGPCVIEVAARTIGGLCARTLRFGLGISLEQLVLRGALGLPLGDLRRSDAAAGVIMLPVPRAGRLVAVDGLDAARAIGGVVGAEITIAAGRTVEPLPEGGRYLGFLFARGPTAAAVERSLRHAAARIEVRIDS